MIDTMKAGHIEGFDLYLSIHFDEFASPEDDDGLTAKQLEAYKNNEWQYVVAVVEAYKFGICLGQASYGMIEHGLLTLTDENDRVLGTKSVNIKDINDYVGAELAGEAISQAEEKISEIREEN